MSTGTIILLWLAFDFVIYLWAFSDTYYYSHNVKSKLQHIQNELFEET